MGRALEGAGAEGKEPGAAVAEAGVAGLKASDTGVIGTEYPMVAKGGSASSGGATLKHFLITEQSPP